ncbi:MAG: hypothetical protein IPO09_20425 [Anaeromyxobacter sp.]|nr:hypothetical protein [Anaeromyxobacter sp.]MBL0274843.1 hypothetical protein [Anaeromyxobacter sp.]
MLESNTTADTTPVRVAVAAQFTQEKASSLHQLALRVPPGTSIDLYFGEVRECQDAALLLLARDVITGTAHFVFHGLTHHQAVLLGYLGLPAWPARGWTPRRH